MDPVSIGTMAVISMATTAAASGVAAYGQAYAGEAQAQAAKYKAGVAKVNEQIAKQNAEYAVRAGEYEAYRQGVKTRFQLGQTRAIQAGRGIDIRGGSAARVQESVHQVGLQDQGMIRAKAARSAYGHEIEATGQRAEQGLLAMGEESSRTAGYIGAGSSILGGVASVSGKWMDASRSGMLGGSKTPSYYQPGGYGYI